MFWGYLETGVAIVAACLPLLRPLFKSWSLESVIRSVRSAISLRTMSSRGRSSSNSRRRTTQRSESEVAITGVPYSGPTLDGLNSVDVEAYAMGKVSGNGDPVGKTSNEGVWKQTEVKQNSQKALQLDTSDRVNNVTLT